MKKFTSLAKKIICLMLCLIIVATPIIQDPVGSDEPTDFPTICSDSNVRR